MPADRTDRAFALQWRTLILLLLLIGSASAYWLYLNRNDVTTRERERLTTQARTVEMNLSSQMLASHHALLRIRADLQRWRKGDAMSPDASLHLKTLEEAMPGVRTLTIIDAGGKVLAANRDELLGKNLGHRPYFTVARDANDPRMLHLAPPFHTSLGVWAMLMVVSTADAQGRFTGIVSATLDPEYFRTLLTSVSYAPDFRASVVHGDGLLFINQPAVTATRGTNLNRPGSMFERHLASGEDVTIFSGPMALTGERRMLVQQTVRLPGVVMDKPIVIAISRDIDAIYAPWRKNVAVLAGLFLLLAAGNVAGLARYQRRTRKLGDEASAVRAENERLLQRYELLLDSAGEGIFGIDTQGRCTFINPAALAMLGFERREEVLGMDAHSLFHHQHNDGSPYLLEECPLKLTLQDGLRRRVEDVYTRRDGRLIPVQITVTAMLENARIAGAEVVFQDIGRRKEMERELIRLATTDPLTGIANRRRFLDQLGMELQRIKRFGQPATMLMLDIDHFKQVNDGYGHAVGDSVLRHFAELTQQSLRRIDLFGRLGGEEFGILLPGTALEGAIEFAERLREQVAETPASSEKGEIRLTVSIGAAEFDSVDPSPDSILARADVALYRAKGGGRNRVEMS